VEAARTGRGLPVPAHPVAGGVGAPAGLRQPGHAGGPGRRRARHAGRGMILGLGVDLVDVARFDATLRRTPALRPRLFTESERGLATQSLAARFAAKEALAKALGAP